MVWLELAFTEIRPDTSDTEDFTVNAEFDTRKVILERKMLKTRTQTINGSFLGTA